MNTDDKSRFQANYRWFNRFFDDLQQLLETISKACVRTFGWETETKNWYYGKSNYKPSLPPHYATVLSGGTCAVQIYAVLDTTILENQPAFKDEVSLVIVKHSRADRVLWLNDYGLRIMNNRGITQSRFNEKVIAGEFLAGDGQGAFYYAFQVPLDQFGVSSEIDAVIQTEILDVLQRIPDWEREE